MFEGWLIGVLLLASLAVNIRVMFILNDEREANDHPSMLDLSKAKRTVMKPFAKPTGKRVPKFNDDQAAYEKESNP